MLRPHIAWPVRLDSTGRIFTVEQDSDDDIASCMATCLLWPLGTRQLEPDFGISNPLFRQGGPDLNEIRQQLLVNEPRAETTISLDDASLAGFAAQVRVGFNQAPGNPGLA